MELQTSKDNVLNKDEEHDRFSQVRIQIMDGCDGPYLGSINGNDIRALLMAEGFRIADDLNKTEH